MQVKKKLAGTANFDIEEYLDPMHYKEVSLEYYLLEVDECTQYQRCEKIYGVQITKTEKNRYNAVNTETELVPHISSDKEGVKEILDRLIKNKVTPISLKNIIEDIAGVKN